MGEDKLELHRKVETRRRFDEFDKKLLENCEHAVSHEKLRSKFVGKTKKIERLLNENE